MISEATHNGPHTNNGEEFRSLKNLSKDELQNLLSDQKSIKQMAMESLEILADKEACMKENRLQAENNLALEPQFLVNKNELANVYKIYKSVEMEYTKLKSEVESFSSKQSPSVVLSLLQLANAEADEKSENIANQFLEKSMDVDTFLKEFILIRKLCNERRFKSEKLAEQLSSLHFQSTLQEPQMPFSTTPVRDSMGCLYPTIRSNNSNFGTSGRSGSPMATTNYGFNI